ncbi:uncharacterized protein KQ657_001242 [Scheffersomyces spartinae]|uniref:Origin recognition complex subunit 3 n=1 Tax=Scheffersomyces spartinae TaxID=45513 RepID=A0A9P8AIH2_9ASCO|nr:uncharacterized protein KQ657_001242 [Scheffersomyces spartinae]KAG7193125.1 hypothetical protein KQ657_001242 [Scheffersomyces spartinae]
MPKRLRDPTSLELLNHDTQKTHYFLERDSKKRRQNKADFGFFNSTFYGSDSNNGIEELISSSSSYFPRLFRGKEPLENVKIRQKLFEEIWRNQSATITSNLNDTNTYVYNRLYEYITTSENIGSEKLNVGFLLLGSNTANNIRVLSEFRSFCKCKAAETKDIVRIIQIEAKSCQNIKSALREVVLQFFKSSTTDVLEQLDQVDEEDAVDDDDEEESSKGNGRVNYDFDNVEEYLRGQPHVKLVVVIQDTDSMISQVLHQMIKLLYSYLDRIPHIRLLLGVSSSNISQWINSTLDNQTRTIIHGAKFKTNDNQKVIFTIANNLFLRNHQHDSLSPLMLDPQLTAILYDRMSNADNSVDTFVQELKLCYMIYFYQNPLAVFHDTNFSDKTSKIPEEYFETFKKLPSFKRFIEKRVFEYKSSKDKQIKNEVISLIDLNDPVKVFLESSKAQFLKFKLKVINACNILHGLLKHKREKLEVYKMILNNEVLDLFMDSQHHFKNFEVNSYYVPEDIISEYESEFGTISDENAALFIDRIENQTGNILEIVQSYITQVSDYYKDFHGTVFHENWFLTGFGYSTDDMKKVKLMSLEENYENLMINLLRPNLRMALETGLSTPSLYLGNYLIQNHLQNNGFTKSRIKAPISQLFQVYKDAPVTINIYDMYTAFKYSYNRKDVLAELGLEDNFPDNKYEKLMFSWFSQSCFEMTQMGFLKEKPKADYLEKAIWRGV